MAGQKNLQNLRTDYLWTINRLMKRNPGGKWESAWFHLEGRVPEEWAGQTVATNLDFSGEGLVYDDKGRAIQGITNASIWDANFARTRVVLFEKAHGNDR